MPGEKLRERCIEMYKPLIKKCVSNEGVFKNSETNECTLARGTRHLDYIECDYRCEFKCCMHTPKAAEKTTLGDKV